MGFPWKGALTAGALTLGLVRVLTRKAPASTRPAPTRVALIGDSYAVGLGPELENRFAEFRYEGHVGANTWQWASGKWGEWLAAFRPEVVLVSLGVNDGNAPNVANYQTIVKRLHGLGARVIWIQPPAAVRTPSHEVIASLGVPTVPRTTTPLSADRLHPASYAPWAQEVAEIARGA